MSDMNTANYKNAQILCVGTELLLGDIVNTNAAFLSAQLAELGISVYKHICVGDNPERLSRALRDALSETDLIITSGGLGPTYDDLTKETIAAALGLELELHSPSLDRIKSYFERTGREMTPNNVKQAMIPHGATVFPNNNGTAPAMAAFGGENNSKTVIMLPGPPNELIPLFHEQVKPFLMSHTDAVIDSVNIHFFGIGESALEEQIKDLMINATNPSIAPYCKSGEVRIRVTAKAETHVKAKEMCDACVETIKQSSVGKFIYGIDTKTLENTLVLALRESGKTFACAESCTGGLIAKRITDISGCSDVFLGGCVTYANSVKQNILGVRAETLASFGAVSEQTALEMAEGVRKQTGADIGVSTTGIAGPSGGTPEKPVGTVFVAISAKDYHKCIKLTLSSMKSREYIREVSASNAMHLALSYLNG